MLYRYGRIENGIFLISKGIKVATHTLKLVYDGSRSVSLSTLECNMLAEMSQTLVAWLLVASTSLYLVSAICYLRGIWQMDYSKSIVKSCNIIFHHIKKGTHKRSHIFLYISIIISKVNISTMSRRIISTHIIFARVAVRVILVIAQIGISILTCIKRWQAFPIIDK